MPREPSLLEGLDPDRREAVLARCVPRRFSRRQPLFHLGDAGDGVHLITLGRVVVRISIPSGEEASLTVSGPGDAVGEQSLLVGGRRSASAIALEPVQTLFLSRRRFEDLRGSDARFTELLVQLLASRVLRLTDQLTEALFVPASTRILRRIFETASLYGTGLIPLTQDEVASMAGTTRPTVNRVLRAAESAGAVDLARRKIRVVDAERLQRLIDDD